MQPVRSNVTAREKKATYKKRGIQTGLIKTIQQMKGEDRPHGDWLHTAGPGKLFINYLIYERAVHHDSRYMIVEYQQDLYRKLHTELQKAKKSLVHHPWAMDIKLHRGELFAKAKKEINKGHKVLVIDADFCATLGTLIKTGLIKDMEMIVKLQAQNKQDFFMPLTWALGRDKKNQSEQPLNQIKLAAHKLGGHMVYKDTYRDGQPMASAMWYFPQR